MPRPDQTKAQRESKRILDRVDQQSETLGTSSFARVARRAGDHLTAKDAEGEDAAELWGRRVGRSLGLVAFIGLSYWLFKWLTR